MRVANNWISWDKQGDLLEVRVKDSARNTIYKKRMNINNKREIKRMAEDLKEIFDVNLSEILSEKIVEKAEEKRLDWF